jgi:ERCC4-type nuclease
MISLLKCNRYVLGTIVERKTMADLVGRSAKGDHLSQFERMRMSGQRNLIVLMEGGVR